MFEVSEKKFAELDWVRKIRRTLKRRRGNDDDGFPRAKTFVRRETDRRKEILVYMYTRIVLYCKIARDARSRAPCHWKPTYRVNRNVLT
jgi:hypothetical protein